MFRSSNLPGTSENWDTNWARNNLIIPQDQLRELESIPEFPSRNLPEVIVDQEISVPVLQKESLLQSIAVPEDLNNSIEKSDSCPKSKKQLQKGAPMDSNFDISISYSQPELGSFKSTQLIPKPLKKLDDHILSHKYLKGSTTTPSQQEKEVSAPSQTEVAENMLDTATGLKQISATPGEFEFLKPADASGAQNSKEKGTENVVIDESKRDKSEVELSNTGCVVEDSYRCESIPCGQPVVDPSPSPKDTSVEVPNKQADGSEKIDTDDCRSPDKVKSSLSSPCTSVTNSSSDRKRKSASDTPKHLKGTKRPRNINIQFTANQVKNMLEIIKLTHS